MYMRCTCLKLISMSMSESCVSEHNHINREYLSVRSLQRAEDAEIRGSSGWRDRRALHLQVRR